MTALLASVTGPEEAEIAIAGGADFIDLKDPTQGALRAVSPEVLQETVTAVAGRRPVSAVAGDLPMEPELVAQAVSARRAAQYVKIGLFPAAPEKQRAVIAGLEGLAREMRLIAVFFADAQPNLSLLPALKEAGFVGAMLDTLHKSGDRLISHLPLPQIKGFVDTSRRLGLMCGLAGSLEAPDVPRLAVLAPDYLGFRGALTRGARGGAIDAEAVARLKALIVGSAGGVAEDAAEERLATDRIFVRDMEVEMEIGAYGFERGRTQKVRFTVEADIRRRAAAPRAIDEVYSYDIIMDGVRTLVHRGHTDLVETLAEELAAFLLQDRRLAAVTVRVEKLELGPGAVGIEIRRPLEV
ncbi:dihydroneopterin aldolase [Aurantimonas sp. MSK8Z-1]|uniref:(5-formylfuran-3-yl)methyl phosphate synthase n=1 Tax=Mangrovibrevibacter kandeliae TaxID=2968473 RepID=UPI0021173299|nr:(5-formylfuran-3-yl)methyl phosphate synthase [Aurantimonas sp. MSK8Z-1]MCW4115598.1 dihydroneopterin aldolase [Aurantimonas sp. MSK8Z-1]